MHTLARGNHDTECHWNFTGCARHFSTSHWTAINCVAMFNERTDECEDFRFNTRSRRNGLVYTCFVLQRRFYRRCILYLNTIPAIFSIFPNKWWRIFAVRVYALRKKFYITLLFCIYQDRIINLFYRVTCLKSHVDYFHSKAHSM